MAACHFTQHPAAEIWTAEEAGAKLAFTRRPVTVKPVRPVCPMVLKTICTVVGFNKVIELAVSATPVPVSVAVTSRFVLPAGVVGTTFVKGTFELTRMVAEPGVVPLAAIDTTGSWAVVDSTGTNVNPPTGVTAPPIIT